MLCSLANALGGKYKKNSSKMAFKMVSALDASRDDFHYPQGKWWCGILGQVERGGASCAKRCQPSPLIVLSIKNLVKYFDL